MHTLVLNAERINALLTGNQNFNRKSREAETRSFASWGIRDRGPLVLEEGDVSWLIHGFKQETALDREKGVCWSDALSYDPAVMLAASSDQIVIAAITFDLCGKGESI